MFSRISSDTFPDILSGIFSDIHSGTLSGISSDILPGDSGKSFCTLSDTLSGMSPTYLLTLFLTFYLAF